MKSPIRSSAASSVRPATGVPIGMSSPAPRRVSRTATAAWITMNALVLAARASSVSRACSSAGTVNGMRSPEYPATAGRGRSVGRSSCSGRSASCRSQ